MVTFVGDMDDKKVDNTDLFEHHRIVVDPGQTPLRIDRFLLDKLMKASRSRIQNAIQAGNILVNDKVIKSNHKVKPLEVITVNLPHPPAVMGSLEGEDIPLDIRYEDDDIMIIFKPPGLVVHPGVGNKSGTLVNALIYYLNNNDLPVLGNNSADRAGIVHRIDKNTSGLMVIAKNDEAMTHLGKQFHDHEIDREYYAIVWGAPEPAKGTIEANIDVDPKNRIRRAVVEDDMGKHAITHYEIVQDLYYVSLVKCRLETGRTHQIRVHMKHIGSPLFNDTKYDGDRVRKGTMFTKYKHFVYNCFKEIPRHALHAKSLGFIHPRTGEKMFFESELPKDMTDVLQKWVNYLNAVKK